MILVHFFLNVLYHYIKFHDNPSIIFGGMLGRTEGWTETIFIPPLPLVGDNKQAFEREGFPEK